MSCISSLGQIKQNQFSSDFFGGWFVPFRRSEERVALLSSRVDDSFTLKVFVFSIVARLFHDTLCLAFVSSFRGIDRLLLNVFGVKTYECCGVSCEGVMIAFLFGSAPSSLSEDGTSGFFLVGATVPDTPGKGEAFRVIFFFCDTGSGTGVSVNVKMLQT
jgi:hypothetical protein